MEKRYVVRLTEEERGELESIVSRGKANARRIVHAQVLLKVDADGPKWTDAQTVEAFGISTPTVHAIRQRFVLEGLESALNRKKASRPPRERKLDGAQEARLIAIACGPPPAGRARWTLKLLANQMVELKIVDTVSYETVRQALKKTNSSRT